MFYTCVLYDMSSIIGSGNAIGKILNATLDPAVPKIGDDLTVDGFLQQMS